MRRRRVEVAGGQGGLGECRFQDPQHAPVAAAEEIEDPARRGLRAGCLERPANGVERRHAGAEVDGEVVAVHEIVGRDLVDHLRERKVESLLESLQERDVAFDLVSPQDADEHPVIHDRKPLQRVGREPVRARP